MERIRLGNNIAISWALYDLNGRIHSLEDKEVQLYVSCGGLKQAVTDYTIQGNVVSWVFLGTEQKKVGLYKLILVETDALSGAQVVDVAEAFRLVSETLSAVETGEVTKNVSVRSVLTYSNLVGVESVDVVESSEDDGINLVSIRLVDGNVVEIPIKNGSKGDAGATGATGATGPKGDKGDIGERGPAGIDSVEASIGTNDPTQAPSVDKDLTEGVLSLTFNNIKGAKGDQGEPAVAVDKFVTVEATAQTTAATDVLPATGDADTVYRVANWDGTQYDDTAYTEYGWYDGAYKLLATRTPGIDDEPTANSNNLVKSGGVAAQISQLGQDVENLEIDVNGGHLDTNINSLFNFTNGGFYLNQTVGNSFTGSVQSTTDGDYSPSVDVSQYDIVTVESLSTGVRAVILTDSNNKVVFSGVWNSYQTEHKMTINVSELGGKYLYVSKNPSVAFSIIGIKLVTGIKGQINAINAELQDINDTVEEIEELKPIVEGGNVPLSFDESSGYMYLSNAALYPESGSLYKDIDLSEYAGAKIIVRLTDAFPGSRRYTGIAVNGSFVDKFIEGDYVSPVEWTIPKNAHLLESHRNSSTIELTISYNGLSKDVNDAKFRTPLYVSPDGNDSNDGSESSPLLTINKAIDKGAQIVLLKDGVFEQQIDLAFARKQTICIQRATPGSRPIIKAPNTLLLNNGSETLQSGTTKVYKATVNSTFGSALSWIYQESVNDANTLISDAERHPLQRGREYRCENTLIRKTDATVLADAITEIENYSGYKWFYDSDNSTLYFSRPQTTSTTYAIRKGSSNPLFLNIPAGIQINMSGVEIWYQKANFYNMFQPHISDCAVKYPNSDCFGWNNTVSAIFERCEAARAQYITNGDGFNAHSTYSQNVNVFAKYTTARLIDCWAHDCLDDGYSDHERCEITIQGGLYEYCGKAGVTPSYGTHCCCYGVISRRNFNGFSMVGYEAAEGGKYGQLLCVSCVASNNYQSENNNGIGFNVATSGNKVICIGCKSNNNRIGYSCSIGTFMELMDCGSFQDGNPSVKGGSVSVKNTTLIE